MNEKKFFMFIKIELLCFSKFNLLFTFISLTLTCCIFSFTRTCVLLVPVKGLDVICILYVSLHLGLRQTYRNIEYLVFRCNRGSREYFSCRSVSRCVRGCSFGNSGHRSNPAM